MRAPASDVRPGLRDDRPRLCQRAALPPVLPADRLRRHAADRRGRPGAGRDGPTISIRFDANADPQLPWVFRPEATHQTIPIGARNIAFYTARNPPAAGDQASFNVTPIQAGRYFTKIQCFCFTEQTLQPHRKCACR